VQYECGRCYEVHAHYDDAIDCCPVDITEVYVCPVCDEGHEKERDALNCCPDADADPDAPSRGPTGLELEAQGQLRLIA
jgi:hypothetical protein